MIKLSSILISIGWDIGEVTNFNEYSIKDDLIKDFYDDWLIDETCDTVTLESSHPLKPPNSEDYKQIFYTHECKDNEIAYFKVDVNLIFSLPATYLGNVWKFCDINYWWHSTHCVTEVDIWKFLKGTEFNYF